jgi:Fe-Mn family superoxide dismutase
MNAHSPSVPLDRRTLLAGALATSATVALGPSARSDVSNAAEPGAIFRRTMLHELPPLPYADTALEPHITARTFSFHYDKHHRAYVENLNGLVKEAPDLAALKLEDLIRKVAGDASKATVFNNAAQAWNHTFYWHSMRPKGGGEPSGKLSEMIRASFGDYARFKDAFATAAKTQFGSGWAWLVADGDKLAVEKTANADTPMARGKKCLLTIDVWEHAYYLDFQNRRTEYVSAFLDHLVNWDFAAKNLE